MELKLNAGDKIQIPDNCNAVIKDGVVVIEENGTKFKRGDFVESMGDIHIVSDIIEDKLFFYVIYHSFSKKVNTTYCDWGIIDNFRLATDSEKQLLLDKLHENGKDWDAEKCEIVDLKYVPKAGDCLKLEHDSLSVFIECSGLEDGKYPCGYETIIDCGGVYEHNFMPSGWGCQWHITKITREELQSEFNKLGYEYDFNTHTAKKIEWKPKNGDITFWLSPFGKIEDGEFTEGDEFGVMDFRTRELAESALELLKNAKHY